MAIDRMRLVRRHNPVLRGFNADSPLSVGNGELAFTMDFTGLQTFPRLYAGSFPLCTQSQWGWHSRPLPAECQGSLRLEPYDAGGRTVGYATSSRGQERLFDHLRENPHRMNLASIGLVCRGRSGWSEPPEAAGEIRQELDLWAGIVTSEFHIQGSPVKVVTACHPDLDAVSVRVESPPSASGLGVKVAFPYGSPDIGASDWSAEDAHTSRGEELDGRVFLIRRVMDDTCYDCRIHHPASAEVRRAGSHSFVVGGSGRGVVEAVFRFQPGAGSPGDGSLAARDVEEASRRHWERFWTGGGCIECSGSADHRAGELERRIVLSQYLTAINCAGSLPPQETGLSCNSWYGKFHLEMHWWHAAHFPLWGRPDLLARSLGWYGKILASAAARARSQGYEGARWPKMTAPDGADSPSPIGPLIVWQQPHLISMAELMHRARAEDAVLRALDPLVEATAEFMASFTREEGGTGGGTDHARLVLGPPLIPAQENHRPEDTQNPCFELEYWVWGLHAANELRTRRGLPPNGRWADVADRLSTLPRGRLSGGEEVYLAHERCPDTFGAFAHDHPSMLAAMGVLPGARVDRAVMSATLDAVLKGWDFPSAWGWDFPMIAMTATRLGRPREAVDALLMDSPKNTYLPNGHNPQRPNKDLPLYLPGNGALLIAAAMMAAGWDGAEDPAKSSRGGDPGRAVAAGGEAPGFPKGWAVEHEGIIRMP